LVHFYHEKTDRPFFGKVQNMKTMPQFLPTFASQPTPKTLPTRSTGGVRYCVDKKLLEPVFVEDTISGETDWRDRHLGKTIRGQGRAT
jgi:hypothetical protein